MAEVSTLYALLVWKNHVVLAPQETYLTNKTYYTSSSGLVVCSLRSLLVNNNVTLLETTTAYYI